MTQALVSRFLGLLTQPSGPHTFNPWTDLDPTTDADPNAPAQRLARLRAHLDGNPRWILIGEAPGYQGCKVSGIPFTSERLLREGAIPRIDLKGAAPQHADASLERTLGDDCVGHTPRARYRRSHHPVERLSLAPPQARQSALQPNTHAGERESGRPVLLALLKAFPNARLFALGRQAEHTLAALGISATPLRHPAMGGATKFRAGLRRALLKR